MFPIWLKRRKPIYTQRIAEGLENSTAELIERYSKRRLQNTDVGVGTDTLLSRFPNLSRYGLE